MPNLTIADLRPRITIQPRRYTPGTGEFNGRLQVGDDRFDLRETITFSLGDPESEQVIVGLQNLPYDIEVRFDAAACCQLPGLFLLNNGLPEYMEVAIPDDGFASRNFYLVGGRFVCTAVMLKDPRAINRQLEYMLDVLSGNKMLICTQMDTRICVERNDVEMLYNIIDSGALKKNERLQNRLRDLAARLRLWLQLLKKW